VHFAGTFHFASQNGHQSNKYEKAWLSQVKPLVEFQRKLTRVISTIPTCAYRPHVSFPAQNGHQSY
jgi:hypothetical protein